MIEGAEDTGSRPSQTVDLRVAAVARSRRLSLNMSMAKHSLVEVKAVGGAFLLLLMLTILLLGHRK